MGTPSTLLLHHEILFNTPLFSQTIILSKDLTINHLNGTIIYLYLHPIYFIVITDYILSLKWQVD